MLFRKPSWYASWTRWTMPRGRLAAVQATSTVATEAASVVLTKDPSLKIDAQGMKCLAATNPVVIAAARATRTKNAVETHWAARCRLFRPSASATRFRSPFPMPKSANVRKTLSEVIVTKMPYRLAPSMRNVRDTESKLASMDVIRATTDPNVARIALRCRSCARPAAVDKSNGTAPI